VQEMSVTAERFDVASRASVHKGDDCIFSGGRLANFPGNAIWSLRDVKIKLLEGHPAYHAGRFLLCDDICIDPVRRFLKHFARSDNSKVSNDELFLAVQDWKFHPSEEMYRNLKVAAGIFYPDFSEEDVDVMIRTAANLSDRAFFDETYPVISDVLGGGVIEFKTECALQLYKYMFGKVRPELEERLLTGIQSTVADIFRNRYHGRVFVHLGKIDRRLARPGVHVERDHVYLVKGPTRGNTN